MSLHETATSPSRFRPPRRRVVLAAVLFFPLAAFAARRAGLSPVPAWIPFASLFVLVPVVLYTFHPPRRVPLGRVAVDAERITHTAADGTTATARWADLREIRLVHTPEGELSWVFVEAWGAREIPAAATGAAELLTHLEALPGYDQETALKAVGSTSPCGFTCWRREGGAPAGTGGG